MLHFLPAPVLCVVTVGFLITNLLLWSVFVYSAIIGRLIVPINASKRFFSAIMLKLTEGWTTSNNIILSLTQKLTWDINGYPQLLRRGSYLVNSNHQSMVDILVLQKVFNRKIPFPRFFIKQELIWVPILGLVWWALDYPFMKRYSADFLAKFPHLKGRDLQTTRKKCEKFRNIPITIINFLEGSRFTPEKHKCQKSTYRNLLNPKAGGIAFVLNALGDKFTAMLNVTIVYPEGPVTFWRFLSGKVRKIIVYIEQETIQPDIWQGNYADDPLYRERFQEWVRDFWSRKDRLIDHILHMSRINQSCLSVPPPDLAIASDQLLLTCEGKSLPAPSDSSPNVHSSEDT